MELLKEYGIDVDIPSPQTKQKSYVLECCGPVEEHSGMMSCINCGKVLQDKVLAKEFEPCFSFAYRHKDKSALGADEHSFLERKRYYKPLTHFRQHMNSYLGKRHRVIPEWLLNSLRHIDISKPDAYIVIKKQLKEFRQACYYKDIYSILYQLGAPIPNFKHVDVLEQEFKSWHYQFVKFNKFGKHNTPTLLMLLHIFFERLNHKPFYTVPYLKSIKLRHRVFEIDKHILESRGDTTNDFANIRVNAIQIG